MNGRIKEHEKSVAMFTLICEDKISTQTAENDKLISRKLMSGLSEFKEKRNTLQQM